MKRSSFVMSILAVMTVFAIASAQDSFAFEIWSRAFRDGELIPVKYTGISYNFSPPLEWKDPPEGTKSFVLIVDDPDAPTGVWTHWVAYDIPSSITRLNESLPLRGRLYNGMKQGKNSFGTPGYGGPYPPPGRVHRYVFTLYALDTALNLPPGMMKEMVREAMEGHVLAECGLTGMFGR